MKEKYLKLLFRHLTKTYFTSTVVTCRLWCINDILGILSMCKNGCWSNRRPPNSPPTRLIAPRSARVKAPPGVESIRRRSIFFRYYEHITCPRNEFTLMINYLYLWKAVYDSIMQFISFVVPEKLCFGGIGRFVLTVRIG